MSFVPYLFFDGACEEALGFYAEVFGGTVEGLSRYADMPPGEADIPESHATRVMNATLRAGGATLMASDGMGEVAEAANRVSLYRGFAETDKAARIFARLAEGGEVMMPFGPTFWTPGFGHCRDRFGIRWMIGVDAPPPDA